VHDASELHEPMTQRGARVYLATQAESGHLCPVTMTHACLASLAAAPEIMSEWKSTILSRTYSS
jgi:putative acyl-CoA dehydrogenase